MGATTMGAEHPARASAALGRRCSRGKSGGPARPLPPLFLRYQPSKDPRPCESRLRIGSGNAEDRVELTTARPTHRHFGPIADLPGFFGPQEATFVDGVVALISLPLLTRPALGVLDMPVHKVGAVMIVGEWLYFLILLLAYALALYLGFRWAERRWLRLR